MTGDVEPGWFSEKIALRDQAGVKGVFALEPIARDERIVRMSEVFTDHPNRYSIQVGENLHQDGTDELDDYLNHSCHPNAYIDFTDLSFRAIRDIAAGEEITWNYLTTEWHMAVPFECWCDAHGPKVIRGLAHESPEEVERLRPWLAPHLAARV